MSEKTHSYPITLEPEIIKYLADHDFNLEENGSYFNEKSKQRVILEKNEPDGLIALFSTGNNFKSALSLIEQINEGIGYIPQEHKPKKQKPTKKTNRGGGSCLDLLLKHFYLC